MNGRHQNKEDNYYGLSILYYGRQSFKDKNFINCFITTIEHFTLQDVNRWPGVVLITCRLL